MKTVDPIPTDHLNRNEDPITHEPGSHPISTGVGAMGGVATGGAIGTVVAGPIGGVVGALIGAVAGGIGGSAVGEVIEPTQDNLSWENRLAGLEAEEAEEARHAASVSPAPESSTNGLEEVLYEHGAFLETAVGREVEELSYPTHEEIAAQAWDYYEADGRMDGRDLDHWLRSENELKTRRAIPTSQVR